MSFIEMFQTFSFLSTGYWLSPDFSQCRLKSGTRPFVLLWLTFASLRNQLHWQSSYAKSAIAEVNNMHTYFTHNFVSFFYTRVLLHTFYSTLQLQLYMGNLPVSTITIHYYKRSKLAYGHMQSFKITLQPEGTFNDTDLQLLKDTISQNEFLNYRPIITRNDTYGVLGFIPKGMNFSYTKYVHNNYNVLHVYTIFCML